ncbi:MAG: hypothetical protein AAF570_04050, partial [Bacteroidota bacterium]
MSDLNTSEQKRTFRQRIFRLIDEDIEGYRANRIFNGTIVLLIILNVVAIVLESDDYYAIEYKFLWDEI